MCLTVTVKTRSQVRSEWRERVEGEIARLGGETLGEEQARELAEEYAAGLGDEAPGGLDAEAERQAAESAEAFEGVEVGDWDPDSGETAEEYLERLLAALGEGGP